MRALITWSILLLVSGVIHAQHPDSVINNKLSEAVLSDIARNFAVKAHWVDSTVSSSNKKIDSLNQKLADLKSTGDKVTLLQQRIKALEDKQKAIDLGELSTYQANYESALINLITLEKEIRPFLLLDKTRIFYSSLHDLSNPMNYAGYQDWIKSFKAYIEREKKKDAMLQITSNLLGATGGLTGSLPLTGAFSQVLFQSLSVYVNSIPKRKKELRAYSEKMFALTLKLSQFRHDRDLIEVEGDGVATDLESLEASYQRLRKENFAMIGIIEADFQQHFVRQTDAFKILDYLNQVGGKTAMFVTSKKAAAPRQWKDQLYYQMMDIQALKIRFGDMIVKLKNNMAKYASLMEKYKTDKDIKSNIDKAALKLADMNQVFEKTFNPSDYITSAARMYKVN